MSPTDRADIPSHVMTRVVGGEIVILDLASGTYFGLDPVGARVWQLLEAQSDLASAAQAIADEFDVTPQTALADILQLTSDLAAQGLISARS